MFLPVTAATAAVLTLLLLILAVMTVRRRLRFRVAFGDGGHDQLMHAIRAHANLAEHAPLVLILIAVVEAAGGSGLILAILAAAFVLGRVSHVFGLYAGAHEKPPATRTLGVLITWAVMAILALWAIALALGAFA